MDFINFKDFMKYFNTSDRSLNSGTLRFYGDWFGRPMDNCHIPNRVFFKNDSMYILFDDDYLITIVEPKNISIDNFIFSVRKATTVKYEYGHYGRNNESRKYFIEYAEELDGIVKKAGLIDGDNVNVSKFNKGHNAFEIIGERM